jgi:heme-degrading monooxygenase HmoA
LCARASDADAPVFALDSGENMPFVRLGKFKAKEEMIDDLCRIYAAEAIPTIRTARGNLGAFLFRPQQPTEDFMAMTVWRTKQDAEAYEQSGLAKAMVDKIRHTFASAPTLLTFDAYGFDTR